MIEYKVKEASGLILWFMMRLGFYGWTSLWNTIYVRPGYVFHTRLIMHEQCHAQQMQREGKLKFMIRYSYYLLTRGYYDNPYEIEARRVASL